MPLAAIALGSNLGDRAAHIGSGLMSLACLPRTRLQAASSVFETTPIGPIPQGPYLNAAALVSTELPPRELLILLQRIERSRGRDRVAEQRWGPRTLDLDLLLYGDVVINEPGLTLPHPRLRERAFVLVPLAAIGPDLIIPSSSSGLATTVRAALASLHPAGDFAAGGCTLYQSP